MRLLSQESTRCSRAPPSEEKFHSTVIGGLFLDDRGFLDVAPNESLVSLSPVDDRQQTMKHDKLE